MALPRHLRTEIVNNHVVKTGKRKLENKVMEQYEALEKQKCTKERENELNSSGVIQEVAETLLGGHDRLRQAVSRGLWGHWT